MVSSPYLKAGRLSDVIAAITTLGSYKFYKLDAAGWADRISGRQKTAGHWAAVFAEHPEFFRQAAEKEKYSLVWRRQFSRNFDVDAKPEDSPDHVFSGEAYERMSRRPLEPSELTALIGVAVNLHQAALDHVGSRRWWIPLAAVVLGFLGSLAGGWINSSWQNSGSSGDRVAPQAAAPTESTDVPR